MERPKNPVTRKNASHKALFSIGDESSLAQYHSIPNVTKIPAGAATTPMEA
jgi:hypothetical protein